MTTRYCRACATARGWQGSVPLPNLTGSVYQAAKFIKHTAPTRSYNRNSTFDDTSVASVRELMINANASGSLEVDDFGRHNVLWIAGKDVGTLTVSGSSAGKQDVVKVVLSHDSAEIHAFPTSSAADLQTELCAGCGQLVFV